MAPTTTKLRAAISKAQQTGRRHTAHRQNAHPRNIDAMLLGGLIVLLLGSLPLARARSLQQQGAFSVSREIAAVLNGLFNSPEPTTPRPPPAAAAVPIEDAPSLDEMKSVLNGLLSAFQPNEPKSETKRPRSVAGPPDSTAVAEPQRGFTRYDDIECVAMRVVSVQNAMGSMQACQEACDRQRHLCRAFTFKPADNTCLLFPDCRDRAATDTGSGVVSGVENSIVGSPFVVEESEEEPAAAGSVFNLYQDTGCADGPALKEVNGISSAEGCQPLCLEEEACRAYTHNPRQRRCYLTSTCIVRETEEGNISGVNRTVDPITTQYNLYERTDCLGDSLAHRGGFDSMEECQSWCDQRDECEAYTFSPDRGRCYLKRDCDERESEPSNISGVKLAVDECTISPPCSTDDPDMLCPEVTQTKGELADPVVGTFEPPYAGIDYEPTYDKRDEYPTCNFQPPRDPIPRDWVDQCIENMRGVDFLRQRKRRPNDECPAGWFLCKGMCYTLVQRNNRGPERGTEYYQDDFMFVESRCGLCGGARVAFVGEDPDMKRVALEAARQTLNEDKATWVRRFRFLKERNRKVERGRPYQPWHLYIEMFDDNRRKATYQRYYTGEVEDIEGDSQRPGWDRRFRNQEGSILCVNTLQRIRQAVKNPDDSNLSMENGCRGEDKRDMWDNDEHRWWPEKHYPFPGH